MKTSYKIIRIRYDTYIKLRQQFKAKYKESAADYFERLAKYLELQKQCDVKVEMNR